MIVQTPDVLGGAPRIEGRRISVAHVAVWHYQQDMSVAEIMERFGLTAEDVHAALAYYATHRREIEDALIDAGMFVAHLRHESKLVQSRRVR